MATKDQERKALDQIKAIVKSLGEDSYIATTFDGVFEMAQQNIDNDWACSVAHLRSQVFKHDDEVRKLKSEAEGRERLIEATIDSKDKQIASLTGMLEAATAESSRRSDDTFKAEEQLGIAEREIIRLKAKLFDLMHPDF